MCPIEITISTKTQNIKQLETNSIYSVNIQSIDVQTLVHKCHPVIYNACNRTETNTVYPPVLFWERDWLTETDKIWRLLELFLRNTFKNVSWRNLWILYDFEIPFTFTLLLFALDILYNFAQRPTNSLIELSELFSSFQHPTLFLFVSLYSGCDVG